MLKEQDQIPSNIEVKNLAGENTTLESYLGKYLVIYFYPKDDTPGCTAESCSLRDYNEDLMEEGIRVLGVSKDSVESHQKFKEKYNLNFELLSDESKELQQAFGVWVEKSMFGKKYKGTKRTTFIVNSEGRIIKVFEKVKTKTHGADVLKFFDKIQDI